MAKIEIIIAIRRIAREEGSSLSIRAASKIAEWILEGRPYDLPSALRRMDIMEEGRLIRQDIDSRRE